MQKKHWTRQRVSQQRRQKRRHPFTDNTTLGDLVHPDCWVRIKNLIASLEDYIQPYSGQPHSLTGLWLDPKALDRYGRSFVYAKLWEFLSLRVDGSSVLRVSKSVFFNYLADPAHSNLNVSAASIKAAVYKAVM